MYKKRKKLQQTAENVTDIEAVITVGQGIHRRENFIRPKTNCL